MPGPVLDGPDLVKSEIGRIVKLWESEVLKVNGFK